MKTRIAILMSLAAAAAVTLGADTPPPHAPGILRWQNGESLSGEMDEGSSDALKWRSPIFKEPLQLRWQALRRIDQPQGPAPVTESFSVILRDGSCVYGNLTGITDTTVSIHSERHGDATLKRAEVLSIRRIVGGNLVLGGPEGDVGWSTSRQPSKSASNAMAMAVAKVKGFVVAGKTGTAQRTEPAPLVPSIANGPAGSFLMPYWNRSASCDLALPE